MGNPEVNSLYKNKLHYEETIIIISSNLISFDWKFYQALQIWRCDQGCRF